MSIRTFARVSCLLVASTAVLSVARPAVAEDAKTAALTRLVQRFTAAQSQYDVATLKDLTAMNYIEVSPIGDVDKREQMLGFYAPNKKVKMPVISVSEVTVQPVGGNSALIIAKLSYTVEGPDGTSRDAALRGSFVADDTSAGWKLLSAQYTSIRLTTPKK